MYTPNRVHSVVQPFLREHLQVKTKLWSFATETKRYGGKGVLKAVDNVNEIIAPALIGMVALDQRGIDAKLLN